MVQTLLIICVSVFLIITSLINFTVDRKTKFVDFFVGLSWSVVLALAVNDLITLIQKGL